MSSLKVGMGKGSGGPAAYTRQTSIPDQNSHTGSVSVSFRKSFKERQSCSVVKKEGP